MLAHGEGECLTGVFSGDKSKDYIKVLSHPDTENSNHRHEEGYYNSLGVLQNRWFAESNWSEGDDDYYSRCPTRQSARQRSQQSPTTTTEKTSSYFDDYRYSHEWDFNESPYIGFPVLPGTTKTIIRLWNRIKTAAGESVTIQVPVDDGRLHLYNGEDNELAQMKVTLRTLLS